MTATADDRTLWLQRRRQGIGASDVAGILGLSPWQSPYSIFCDKTGVSPLDDTPTESMEFGLLLEPVLKKRFEHVTGLWVLGEQTECTHPDLPFLRCTVDGFVAEAHSGSDDITGLPVAEFKMTSDAPAVWEQCVPIHYQCQANLTMAVTGCERVYFGVLHLAFGRPTFRVYEFDRDECEVEFVVAKCTEFWNDHVVTGIAPPTDAHPATSKAMGYWDAEPAKTIEADAEATRLAAEIRELKTAVKDMETAIDTRCNRLKDLMRDAEVLTHGFDDRGRPKVIATWKASTRKQFVKDFAITDFPELAEPPYTIETPTRTFLAK